MRWAAVLSLVVRVASDKPARVMPSVVPAKGSVTGE
jgi:hypothetical protein